MVLTLQIKFTIIIIYFIKTQLNLCICKVKTQYNMYIMSQTKLHFQKFTIYNVITIVANQYWPNITLRQYSNITNMMEIMSKI